ncbi:MAG: antitoxin [Candidatus Omnitrophica bacterium]|nr:antitoxin [Candidatus Omnitrophota bacterium]
MTYSPCGHIRLTCKEVLVHNTKLTLRLEAELVQRAKSFAKKTGKSVSRIVADYFTMLERPPKQGKTEARSWPPLVRSLKGCLRKARVDENDYRRYLEEKHR